MSTPQIAIAEYHRAFRIRLLHVRGRRHPRHAFLIDEALRFGEPIVVPSEAGDTLAWAMPVMRNAQVLGGLVAQIPEKRAITTQRPGTGVDVRRACEALRDLCARHNLSNMALLDQRREESQREQQRAYAIHDFKSATSYNLRGLYMVEEPQLVGALYRGDRGAAREILNRLLVGMVHHARGRFELVKSFFMELVVTLCRTAVEAGGAPGEILGGNYAALTELSGITRDEELAPWLHRTLERLLEAIERQKQAGPSVLVRQAMELVERHLPRAVGRDEAAAAVHRSPSHFSRLFKRETGVSFHEAVTRRRLDLAAHWLARTDRSIKQITHDLGFTDQSYFTRVFRRRMRVTPARYRQTARGGSIRG